LTRAKRWSHNVGHQEIAMCRFDQQTQAFLQQSHSPLTATRYASALREFQAWHTEAYQAMPDARALAEATANEYKRYLQRTRKLAPASVNVRLAALRGLAKANSCELNIKGAKQVPAPTRALNTHELGQLLAQARLRWTDDDGQVTWKGVRDVALISLMARAGLRVGEVVALELGDVDLRERSGAVTVRLGKGAKQRVVPLALQLRKDLQAYLKVRPETVTQSVFLSRTLRPMTSRDIQRLVAEAAYRAKVGEVTPHTLRHTFATRVLKQTPDDDDDKAQHNVAALPALQALLGHSNLATTSRYLHTDAKEMKRLVEEL
jgi:integrase